MQQFKGCFLVQRSKGVVLWAFYLLGLQNAAAHLRSQGGPHYDEGACTCRWWGHIYQVEEDLFATVENTPLSFPCCHRFMAPCGHSVPFMALCEAVCIPPTSVVANPSIAIYRSISQSSLSIPKFFGLTGCGLCVGCLHGTVSAAGGGAASLSTASRFTY